MSDFENAFLGLENVAYTDANTYAFGGYWVLVGTFNSVFLRLDASKSTSITSTLFPVDREKDPNVCVFFETKLPRVFTNMDV